MTTAPDLIQPATTPTGWRTVRFGDVVRNVTISVDAETSGLERYVAGEHMNTDDLHIRQWGTIGDGYLGPAFHRKFVKGQVLYGSRRTYLRKVALADFDGICANTTFVPEPNGDDLLPELLPFIMQTESFSQHAMQQSRGSVNPYVNWRDIAWYEFSLPPKDEQRRIAEILWAADENLFKAKQVQDELGRCKTVLMRANFQPDLLTSTDQAPNLVRLGQLLKYTSDGPFGSKLKTEHYAQSGARVIRLQNIGDGFFEDTDKVYISEHYFNELARYSLQTGDIVIAGLGDETHVVGRACAIPADLGPAVNKADCFCLRANTSAIEQEYLLYFLNSPFARQQITQLAQGTTRSRINVSNLKTILIPLPNREKQQQVVQMLRTLDDVQTRAIADLRSKENLFTSLREHLLHTGANKHVH